MSAYRLKKKFFLTNRCAKLDQKRTNAKFHPFLAPTAGTLI
jgi:hypothetical protein